MITALFLIADANIIDPLDMSGHTMYPSGVKECDKYPRYPYAESKLAKLSIGQNIYADDGRIIKSGHYLISLSIGGDKILFFEGREALYTIKILKKEKQEKPYKLATAEFYTDDTGNGLIILKQGTYKVVAKIVLANKRL